MSNDDKAIKIIPIKAEWKTEDTWPGIPSQVSVMRYRVRIPDGFIKIGDKELKGSIDLEIMTAQLHTEIDIFIAESSRQDKEKGYVNLEIGSIKNKE